MDEWWPRMAYRKATIFLRRTVRSRGGLLESGGPALWIRQSSRHLSECSKRTETKREYGPNFRSVYCWLPRRRLYIWLEARACPREIESRDKSCFSLLATAWALPLELIFSIQILGTAAVRPFVLPPPLISIQISNWTEQIVVISTLVGSSDDVLIVFRTIAHTVLCYAPSRHKLWRAIDAITNSPHAHTHTTIHTLANKRGRHKG